MENKSLIRGILILNIPLFFILLAANVLFFTKVFSITSELFLIASFLFVVLGFVFSYFILKRSAFSIKSIETEVSDLTHGNFESKSDAQTSFLFDIKGVRSNLKLFAQGLQNTVKSIDEISKGNFENDSLNQIENNIIASKLAVLKDTLQKDKEVLEKTKKEEELRNWTANGLARFSDILRQDTHNIQELGYGIISNLVDYVQCNQGALYVLNEDEQQDVYFETVAAVAYDRKKLLNTKIALGEGLVGRCAYEKMTVYLKDIPEDYIKITSGLGTANPNNLLVIPCMLEGKVFGIIELASFKTLEPHEIAFIEKLGESIASTISTVRTNEKTNILLKASQEQSEELAAQEEELRQNLEEMETTQEDLKRQMELNKQMQEQMAFEQFLFNTLLENIPARINFKDRNRRYIRASKSLLDRFGKTSFDEISGKTDEDFFEAEFAKKTKFDDNQIMESKQSRIGFIEHEIKENGEEIWKNVSKIPLIDDEGNCIGIFASVYDITDSKALAKELEKEKQLFDTLLNNIPARINFKNTDRKYIRASKSFLNRFGLKSNDEIVGKTDFDFFSHDFAKQTEADELAIIESKQGKINFVEHEIKDNGEEIWKNVSKIPMLDDEGNVTGVFASVYDITDFKKAELENKKLKEELNKLKNA
jgi:PAS domain S-box-containing protein